MKELHDELLERVEFVGRRSATALQVGSIGGPEVTVGGSANVSALDSDTSGGAITLVEGESGKKFQFFYSTGGAMSRVPPGFVFSKMSLVTLFASWLAGNESLKMVPFKFLLGKEINKKEGYKLCKMRTLMKAVEIAGRRWERGMHFIGKVRGM